MGLAPLTSYLGPQATFVKYIIANGFTLWHYRTAADDLLTPGYFDSAQELLREGDQIIANTAGEQKPGLVNLVVTRVDDDTVAVSRA